MRLAVRPAEFFPRLAALALAVRVDAFVVGDTFPYSRQSAMNRARIRSTAGAMWLSVPVGTAHGRRADAVALDAWPEAARHAAKALRFSYGRTPFYEHYADDLHALFSAPHASLGALAAASTDWLFDRFGLARPLRTSSLGEDANDAPATLAEAVQAAGGTSLLVLPETLGRDAAASGVPTEALAWTEPTYRQPFPGFVPDLSALDALFMRGPQARMLLA